MVWHCQEEVEDSKFSSRVLDLNMVGTMGKLAELKLQGLMEDSKFGSRVTDNKMVVKIGKHDEVEWKVR